MCRDELREHAGRVEVGYWYEKEITQLVVTC